MSGPHRDTSKSVSCPLRKAFRSIPAHCLGSPTNSTCIAADFTVDGLPVRCGCFVVQIRRDVIMHSPATSPTNPLRTAEAAVQPAVPALSCPSSPAVGFPLAGSSSMHPIDSSRAALLAPTQSPCERLRDRHLEGRWFVSDPEIGSRTLMQPRDSVASRNGAVRHWDYYSQLLSQVNTGSRCSFQRRVHNIMHMSVHKSTTARHAKSPVVEPSFSLPIVTARLSSPLGERYTRRHEMTKRYTSTLHDASTITVKPPFFLTLRP